MTKKQVKIYTDGACSGNPGPGGWGAVIYDGDVQQRHYGYEAHATNNQMELQAAIEALRTLNEPHKVTLTTDSQYLRKGITEWIDKWQRNGWQNSQKQPVKNQDRWQLLLAETKKHDIEWKWVRGHSGHPDNELADQLANKAIDESRR